MQTIEEKLGPYIWSLFNYHYRQYAYLPDLIKVITDERYTLDYYFVNKKRYNTENYFLHKRYFADIKRDKKEKIFIQKTRIQMYKEAYSALREEEKSIVMELFFENFCYITGAPYIRNSVFNYD